MDTYVIVAPSLVTVTVSVSVASRTSGGTEAALVFKTFPPVPIGLRVDVTEDDSMKELDVDEKVETTVLVELDETKALGDVVEASSKLLVVLAACARPDVDLPSTPVWSVSSGVSDMLTIPSSSPVVNACEDVVLWGLVLEACNDP